MTHGSLFSGIGGFDLAAEWMGWENAFHCEWNPFGQRVLKYYWPHAKSYTDITKTDFSIHRGTIDVLTGGFPCQPFSTAGQQRGVADERYLWPEMLRAIREVQPCYVVGENVSGLVDWNGGLVFDKVQADLEIEGYEVTPFLLPAAGINAPHKRERVWFVAHATGRRLEGARQSRIYNETKFPQFKRPISTPNATNANGLGLRGQINRTGKSGQFDKAGPANDWRDFPTQSTVCDGNDGISERLDFAAVFGSVKSPRQPARAFGRWRNESIKAGGNAIVPQVAHQIFQAIQQFENQQP